MSSRTVVVPTPVQCWFFRDRYGHRFGPYTNKDEISAILRNHEVGTRFVFRFTLQCEYIPVTEYVMEDVELNVVCPVEWKRLQREAHYAIKRARFYKRYKYRSGPVEGINHGYGISPRSSSYGRRVRDTGNVCAEDMEPHIRVKLRTHPSSTYDHSCYRSNRSWKCYRSHQWKMR